MTLDRLRQIVSSISLGKFSPVMTLEATTKVLADGEYPAVLITIDAYDSENQDDEPLRLAECHKIPDHLITDRDVALYVYERMQDVLLHEMDEFARYRGERLVVAKHPVSDDTYTHVRTRTNENRSTP